MRKSSIALFSGLLLSFSALSSAAISPANAGSRYSIPKNTVLSGDLSSPWILQLKANPVGKQRRKLFNLGESYSTPKQQVEIKTKRNSVKITKRKKKQAVQQVSLQVEKPVKPKTPQMSDAFLPTIVSYSSKHRAGTIVINTSQRFLYLIQGDGTARRYGVGVGKTGFQWSGTHNITRRAQWPTWRPPAEMRARERKKGRELPVMMEGGPKNPLGARALYIGSTLYRIHGTTQPWSIGKAVSSGCIRMRNEDVIDLYERVKVGTKVVVS